MSKNKYPKIKTIMSKYESGEKAPALVLAVSDDVMVEFTIDSFIEATTLNKNEISKSSRIREQNKITGRDIIWTINESSGVVNFYVGHMNEKLIDPKYAEFSGELSLSQIMEAGNEYRDEVSKWIESRKAA